MPVIEVKGENIEFPDTMTDDEIVSAIKKIHGETPAEAPAAPKRAGLNVYSNIGDLLGERWKNIKENVSAYTPEGAVKPWSSVPGRALRGAGNVAGMAVDVGTESIRGGLEQGGILPLLAAINEKTGISSIGRKIAEKAAPSLSRHPQAVQNVESITNLTMASPLSRALFGGIGGAIEKGGQTILKGEAKIPVKIAQKAGATVSKGKDKIIKDISKYNLESGKGFGKMGENAQKAIEERMDIAKNEIASATQADPRPKISLDRIAAKYKTEIDQQGTAIPFDQKERAFQIIDDLTSKAKLQLDAKFDPQYPMGLTIKQADDTRRMFSKGVFKKGGYNIQTDPILDQIKEDLSMRIAENIGEYIPKQRIANKEIRDLINIKKAMEDAEARVSSHNQVLGAGGGIAAFLGAGAGHAMGGSTGEGMLAGWLAQKMLSHGRGAGVMIKAGKKIGGK